MLSIAELRDQIHRPWPEERVGGNEIFDSIGSHLLQQSAHATGLELEHARGVAAAEQVDNPFIVQRQTGEIERVRTIARRAADGCPDRIFRQRLSNKFAALFNCRKRAKTKKVHLEQPNLFTGWTIPLRDDLVGSGRAAQGNDVLQRFCGNDDTGGMYADVAGMVFQFPSGVDDAAGRFVPFILTAEVGVFLQGVIDCDVEFMRHEVGQTLAL